jgi:hypothetical protein
MCGLLLKAHGVSPRSPVLIGGVFYPLVRAIKRARAAAFPRLVSEAERIGLRVKLLLAG